MSHYQAHRSHDVIWDIVVLILWVGVFIALTAVEPVR